VCHRQVCDVACPHLIGPIDAQIAEQIRWNAASLAGMLVRGQR
jgi:hypothetical protein